jgi:hypothetical protein
MLQPFRSDFNTRFTPAKYEELLRLLNQRTQTQIEFRIAETPCFFAPELMQTMVQAGLELTHQLLSNPQYLQAARAATPAEYDVPNQDAEPHFMTVDFGLVRDAKGDLQPKLVELQAFPSLFGYQPLLAQTYIDVFGLDPALQYRFGNMDDAAYWSVLRDTIVGNHDPQNVILAEIEPESQKTLPDFRMYEQKLGIATVDIANTVKEGNRLFYRNASGQLVRIERIFNRVIVDELLRKSVTLPFDYRDELDVEWAGHPNWYFQISKFSIPYLDHPTVPPAVFLDDWFAGKGRDRLPEDRSQWVFKPLYSFAGKGIQFAPSDVDLMAVPVSERHQYLLQERVKFESVIDTPQGVTQPEIRILYAKANGSTLVPMTSLVRMGRGLMMGVDHNRNQTWVGGSAGLFSSG